MRRDLHVGSEVAILGVSLFVLGLGELHIQSVFFGALVLTDCSGIGPLLVGPLSEVYGRSPIYIVSYTVFFALSWAVAFPPDISVYLIFRFFTGFCSAAFLSVAGGSVSDLFDNTRIATSVLLAHRGHDLPCLPLSSRPMAVYTASPFVGPVLGPIVAGCARAARIACCIVSDMSPQIH